MYITGTRYDFLNRLHQLPLMTAPVPLTVTGVTMTLASGNASMASFITEGKGYLSSFGVGTGLNQIQVNESGKWEKEARQQYYRLSGSGAALLTQVF